MRLASIVVVVITPMSPVRALDGQTIPRTVQAAEAEGAALHAVALGPVQTTVAARTYSGTGDRRCVTPPAGDTLAGGSLRSGEILARTQFTGRQGFRNGERHKVLWLPLHATGGAEQPLLIRATRLGNSLDSVRTTVAHATHSHGEDGYPSGLAFTTTGQWLVLVTSGADWGCFIISVAD